MLEPYAALKAAAWAIAASVGYNKAIQALESLIGELKQAQWDGK